MIAKVKVFLKQMFCRHKHTGWYTIKSKFVALNGEKQYKMCSSCGKKIDERFIKHD